MPSVTPDISQELKTKQDDLKVLNAQLADLQVKASGLLVEVQTLDALVADYNRTVATFTAESDRLAKDKKAVDDAVAALASQVADKIKASKDDIDNAIADHTKAIAEQSALADTVRKTAEDARAAADKVAADASLAEARVRDLKNLVQDASQTVSDETSLLKQADTEASANNAAGAYFLLNEAAALKLTLPTPDDLAKSLDAAQQAVIKAQSDATASDSAATLAEDKSKAAQLSLAAAIAARRTTIVSALKPLN